MPFNTTVCSYPLSASKYIVGMFTSLDDCLQCGFVLKIPGRVLILPSFMKFYRSANASCRYFVLEVLSSVFNSKIFYMAFLL